VVAGVVLLLGRQWRVVAGAAAAVAAQLVVALLVTGVKPLAQYSHVLWTLMLNPRLVEIHPTEMHSLRGFFQLLLESPAAVGGCFIAALLCVLAIAWRGWSSRAPLGVRWGGLVLLTVLASPHLLAYDLVLLTLPLLVFADWAVRHSDHPLVRGVSLLLVLVYFAPFSGNLARLMPVQLSVVVMAILAWRISSICTPALETDAAPCSELAL
jgi:hypothetical protein